MKSIIIGIATALIVLAVRFIRSKRKAKALISGLREAGKVLYASEKDTFERFFDDYTRDKNTFWLEHEEVMDDYLFEKDELRPIDVVYIFGDQRRLVKMIDWRGEELTGEVEKFITEERNISVPWTVTSSLRATATEANNRDGSFIIKLLNAVDQDLSAINKQLLVFDLGWDSYVFSVVDKTTFGQVRELAPGKFMAAKELKK